MRSIARVGPISGSAILLAIVVFASAAQASTLTVSNAQDSGAGSLRDAIAKANSGDTILFDSSLAGQTITLTSGELAITKSLDIEGPGASLLTVSGNHQSRIFEISEGLTVTIAGLTITQGRTQDPIGGGGILGIVKK